MEYGNSYFLKLLLRIIFNIVGCYENTTYHLPLNLLHYGQS